MSWTKQRIELNLNTKECCFICLKLICAEGGGGGVNSSISLSALFRYLNVNVGETIFRDTSLPYSKSERWNISAQLCTSCSEINEKFQEQIRIVEIAKMKISYQVNSISEKMKEAGSTPSRMSRYHDRMKHDPISLSSMVTTESLRNRLSKECIKSVSKYYPRVAITRLNSKCNGRRSKPITFCVKNSASSDLDSNSDPDVSDEIDNVSTISEAEPRGTISNVQSLAHNNEREPIISESIEVTEVTLARPMTQFNCKTEIEGPTAETETNKVDPIMQQTGTLSKANMGKRKKKIAPDPDSTAHSETRPVRESVRPKTVTTPEKQKQVAQQENKPSSNLTTGSKETHLRKSISAPLDNPVVEIQTSAENGGNDWKADGKTFPNLLKLKQHNKLAHLRRRRFICGFCNTKHFNSDDELRRHRDAVHYRLRLPCGVKGCTKFFSCVKLLKSHQQSNHPKTLVPKQKSVKHCEVCDKTFSTPHSFHHHNRVVHLNIRKFECDICHQKFGTSYNRSKHRNAVHLRTRVFCDFPGCGKSYSSSDVINLRNHQKVKHTKWYNAKNQN